MVICEICEKELKNASGLRLHMVKHKKDENGYGDNTLVRVELYSLDKNELILSYPVMGKEAINKAIENAKKRKYKIVIKKTT